METITTEIHWKDLSEQKQNELVKLGFYHDNIDLSPIAIIERNKEENERLFNSKKSGWYQGQDISC